VKPRATVGVFGGSGLYSFFEKTTGTAVRTPYGAPSARVTISKVGRRDGAFIPRHGARHELPPHMVPYRANLWAFERLGVERVVAPNAVGSLKPSVRPGDIVFCDQFVNFTTGRKDTFYDGPVTTHVSTADPYCPEMRAIAKEVAARLGVSHHDSGTVVVVQGPRFSTRAESRFFRGQGWDVINMTQYPEVTLAKELGLCYLNIALVTDYDVGVEGDPDLKPVSHEEVIRVFNENMGRLRGLIVDIVKALPDRRSCDCAESLSHARIEA